VDREHDHEAVFREAGPAIWRAVYAFCGGRQDLAEDAVAEAFARAMEHRGIRDPAAWICRVALRVAAQELRREHRQRSEADRAIAEAPADLYDLLKALRVLSPNQRAAIVLRWEAGLSVDEVAHLMGISAATVRVHLHRGRKRLKELLAEEEEHV
jgi:RNA polymerase sigma-70 factor (ECF subfamily)